ncbi:MAG: DUF1924 domain-containing protein [Candidatus Sedimenticola sp. 4PFRAG1]
MKNSIIGLLTMALSCGSTAMASQVSDSLVEKYRLETADALSAELGKQLWNQQFIHEKSGDQHSCSTCHGSDLAKQGKHARTGKKIDPMALSINTKRLTTEKKIEKWFKRNCKWTLGRECTPREKGSFLLYISAQ